MFSSHLLISTLRLSSGLLLGTVIAYPLGLLLGLSKKADALGAPLLFITYPFPKIVLLPVFFLLLGLGDSSRIALIALSSGYQILLLMRAKTKALDPIYLKVMRSMKAGPLAVWRYVLWPAMLPDLLTAVRIASGTAVAVLFLAESFATDSGLGFLIMDAWGIGDNETMFCAILGISLLALSLYTLLWVAEKILCPWFLTKN
ncbi:MAG: ABC transporter permease subunit [Succinatimonas sp.]|nr:ABC transporter permease subunit [Succinatimonas sp.]